MFDPRNVYRNDRRYSYKAQIIQKRPITSEENAHRPVHPSDLERAKVVMKTFGYSWYPFNPVLHCTFKPKADLQPIYVAPYDPFVHSSTLDYWTTDNPEFYKGVYTVMIFLRARNVICTVGSSMDLVLKSLLEDYYCYQPNPDSSPGYGSFYSRTVAEPDEPMTNTLMKCPYTDLTYNVYRLCQSSSGGDYPSEFEIIAIA